MKIKQIEIQKYSGHSKKIRERYRERLKNDQLNEGNIARIKTIANDFSQEGLTFDECLKMARMNVSLLIQRPEQVYHNITETQKKFAEAGLTLKQYIKCVKRNPVLASYSPETIEKNIMGLTKAFANYGLTPEKCIKSALYNPFIFTTKAKTLKNKIYTISNKLNIPTNEVFDLLIKQPNLISISAKTTIKKYELLKYIEENKIIDKKLTRPSEQEFNKLILRKRFTNSKEYLYTLLLRNKISSKLPDGQKLPLTYIVENTIDFIRDNSDNTIEFELLNGKYAKEFIQFSKNLSENIVGKNIFKIKII